MNWEKAKTLTIVFLLLLNVSLAGLIYNAGRRYTLTTAQENAITQYLARNKVIPYSTIPTDFRPMAALRMHASSYVADDLMLAFFGTRDGVTPSFPDGRTMYERGDQRLLIQGNRFTYENAAAQGGDPITRSNATDICTRFLSGHERTLGRHALERATEADGGFDVTFSGAYRNRLITSNSLIFHVNSDGIAWASGVYNEPVALTNDAREIISPDEALYLFVKHMNYLHDDREIILDEMDLVYHLAEVTVDTSIPLNAIPYYRFRVFWGEDLVMINAYTGGVLGGFY